MAHDDSVPEKWQEPEPQNTYQRNHRPRKQFVVFYPDGMTGNTPNILLAETLVDKLLQGVSVVVPNNWKVVRIA